MSAADWTTTFDAITRDPRYLANLDWGEPRSGHPEGSIRAHIAELEGNLETLKHKLSDEQRWKLKLLIHTHDTFKPQAREGIAIAHPLSHASLARAFLAEFCDDAQMLAIVQHHDVPFALYRQYKSKGQFNESRPAALLATIRDWDLFQAFVIIDGCTPGKSREVLRWWFEQSSTRVESKFNAIDIIE